MLTLAPRFHQLFAGFEAAHGVYNKIAIDPGREDGKTKGHATTPREPCTDQLWVDHLEGRSGLGIAPIRQDNTCLWGAIDVDSYDLDLASLATKVVDLPFVPCRTKSGGCHLYIFFKAPVSASAIIVKLNELASKLGIATGKDGKPVEIFPKQSHIREGTRDLPNWINMPYFNAQETTRYAILPNGDAMTPEEFLAYADSKKADPTFLEPEGTSVAADGKKKKARQADGPLPDGPPCLQQLVQIGGVEGSGSNTFLFNLGTYFRKLDPTGWQESLRSANQQYCKPALAEDVVRATIRSLEKKEFNYQCNQAPLSQYCNRYQCRNRKFGIGSSGLPRLGNLRKLLSDPVMWYLDIWDSKHEGVIHTLELTTEEFASSAKFSLCCLATLDMKPPQMKQNDWDKTMNDLLETVQWIPAPEEAAKDGLFWSYVEEFCNGASQATTRAEVQLGKPYTEEARTYFRSRDLLEFFKRKKVVEYAKVTDITRVLKMGSRKTDSCTWNLNKTTVNVWSIPAFPKADALPIPEAVSEDKPIF